MANDFLDPIVQKVTNSKDGTFDDLVNSIGTDVYGSQMRLHLKQSIDTLGRATTQLNGSGESGGTGTGWTDAQIDALGEILNAAGYAETGIGEKIAALLASLHGEKTLISWTVSPETIEVPAGASLNSNSVRKMFTVTAIITDGLEDQEVTITEFTLTGNLVQNSACPVTLSFEYGGVTYSKTVTVNVSARVPVSMTARWFGYNIGDTLSVPFGTTAEELKDAIYAELTYSDGYKERTTDFTVDGTISYKESSAIFVIYSKSASIAANVYAYGEMNIFPEYAMVTYLLEGCVSSNDSISIEAGVQYYASIVATSGSVSSIKVFVDGTDMSESFADSAGVLIPADSVIAGSRIVIIAENTAEFSISYSLQNCSSTNTTTTIEKGSIYYTEIVPVAGYTVDASQTKAVMNGNEYAYSESARTILIPDVQGNVVVYGVAVVPSVETVTVSNHLTNCVSSNGATAVEKGSSYSATITANDGYILDGIVVTMSGTAITSSVVSGNTISIPEVTGDIIITATASEIEVTLTGITAAYSGGVVPAGTTLDQLTGITVVAIYSDGSTATVTGYKLSGSLTAGQTNTITVTYKEKTTTFTVTVEAEQPTSYTVTYNLTNCSSSNTVTSVESGESFVATIMAYTGYDLGTITVTMGGTDITSTAVSSGIISIGNVTGDIVITASATIHSYSITRNLTNCSSSQSNDQVSYGLSQKETITADSGYTLGTVTVTMGGTDVTSTAVSGGSINIAAVSGDIVITATATQITLTGITATYTGGSVAAGTTLDGLTGITVTATYSDGSTATVTDYTLSGTLTAGQDNIVTVTYQEMTATFTVTVEPEAGGTETEISLTWTAGKISYTIGSEMTITTNASDYPYAYSQKITMESGTTYKTVIGVISTLSGSGPVGKWNYRVVFVDDSNIVRAATKIIAENTDNVTTENITTDPTFESGSDVSLATGFYLRPYVASSNGGNIGNPISTGMVDEMHLYKVG